MATGGRPSRRIDSKGQPRKVVECWSVRWNQESEFDGFCGCVKETSAREFLDMRKPRIDWLRLNEGDGFVRRRKNQSYFDDTFRVIKFLCKIKRRVIQ